MVSRCSSIDGGTGRPSAGLFKPDGHGREYAGLHILVNLWGGSRIDDPEHVMDTMREAVKASGAALLDSRLHRFEPHGLTVFVLLAESHFAFHSWPEQDYASIDLFTCGQTDAGSAVKVLRARFAPASMGVVEHKRGLRDTPAASVEG